MKKIITIVSVCILLLVAALTAATLSYSKSADYDNDVLPAHTTVNGIDCSGLTYEQAEAKISDAWNSRCVVIAGNLNEVLDSFTDFGYTYDLTDQLKKVKKNYLVLAAVNHYIKTPLNVNIPMIVTDYDEAFKEKVTTAKFLNRKGTTVSKDAYVDTSDPDFPIIPEVYGTETDTERFFTDLTHHIQAGELNFIFDERKYYTMPEVVADDPDLKKYQEYCRNFLSQKITYELGEETFTLSTEQLDHLMKDDMSGVPDEAAIAEYVAQLSEQYDNIGVERNFTSLSGREVKVKGGTYGWQIDKDAEATQLIADISSHKDVSREPVFSKSGYGPYSRALGNTYIDVDVSNQVVKYYKEGELYFSSNCVTGCKATGTTTNIGTFYILNKARNVVLRGNNADGSQYASPVKYWLGINWSGEGFHDASWRSSFGGNIWISNGSHGCVNMPPNRMGELYEKAEEGIPVVVHY